jgi:hypothetical protein
VVKNKGKAGSFLREEESRKAKIVVSGELR